MRVEIDYDRELHTGGDARQAPGGASRAAEGAGDRCQRWAGTEAVIKAAGMAEVLKQRVKANSLLPCPSAHQIREFRNHADEALTGRRRLQDERHVPCFSTGEVRPIPPAAAQGLAQCRGSRSLEADQRRLDSRHLPCPTACILFTLMVWRALARRSGSPMRGPTRS